MKTTRMHEVVAAGPVAPTARPLEPSPSMGEGWVGVSGGNA